MSTNKQVIVLRHSNKYGEATSADPQNDVDGVVQNWLDDKKLEYKGLNTDKALSNLKAHFISKGGIIIKDVKNTQYQHSIVVEIPVKH
ncbi:hypothetical protein [Helicobacter ailurogastricus]|uniref:Uncharacterized protein n=1 Tax=Helicobacter ailurogastricus TaxID=1578720 RepID=A0A0K2X8Q2_9HELI|nr:hypothetical protein [Helicobacter ailurogastricus]CRF40487.1 hypothetical protein HAL011_02450 [Helicobacter ailurogastricus]CRF42867.1 hypothetical protein HAL013_10780 [Helicobacter ailurogastricus]CRF43789.1 hypothetical protein HAL09_03410 [Helicobacter ailurogastricus]